MLMRCSQARRTGEIEFSSPELRGPIFNTPKRRIQEINWRRKQEQTTAGQRLTELEETWVGLVGKNYEIEQAILELERNLGLDSAVPPST
ncbi:unnamed protein product [Echinostoma caproni]|uniref:Pre-mRNA-splicing factor SPF27 n=1 Tax=Echinostoma caproni TaxID=27848 RepID=A0A183B1U0_9TREM|nr:unnamed protein product [Echinostoma caproni]